ncbi:MAG: M67 family metallopeptidase [Lachnospiraceae bacterium]|nr:M67 family metallopeptidase [Lachnospiraceae bacterium]
MNNIIKIDRALKQELSELAAGAYPRECCAVLFSKDGRAIDDYCRLPNRSKNKNSYAIDPMELYACEKEYAKRGYEITGFFHSHPDAPAVMSKEDERNAIPSMLYLLASVSKDGCDGMRLWRLDA